MTDEQLEPLAADLGVPVASLPRIRPRYNIAPTDEHPIARMEFEDPEVILAKWGLINHWIKDPKKATQVASRQINARAESLFERAAYREAIERRRCIVPADGFFEWSGPKTDRRPYWYHRPDGGLIYFAGLYDFWKPGQVPGTENAVDEAHWQPTFTIVTTTPNALIEPIHDRMPVIIPGGAIDAWLDVRNVPASDASKLLVPAPDDLLVARTVSNRVNSVKNDTPDLLIEERALL